MKLTAAFYQLKKCLVVLLVFLSTDLYSQSPREKSVYFSGLTPHNIQIQSTDYKGKYLLLDFWASWCLPCRMYNPKLKKYYALYHDKGLEIIGIASNTGMEDAWKKAIEKDQIPWPQILDNSSFNDYKINTIPYYILIDTSGNIIERFGQLYSPKRKLKKTLSKIF